MLVLLLLACLGSVSAKMRIVNGANTDRDAHPWQIALLTSSGSFTCGGSIIANNWVLTAAHCVQSSGYYINLNNGFFGDSGGRNISVAQIIRHPNYGSGQGAFPNDVALLKTTVSLIGNGHSAITMNSAGGSDFSGQTCTITGWGRIYGGGPLSAQLQVTSGTILSNTGSTRCSLNWGSNYNHAVHICIHNENTGACNGDSGGPMVCGGVLAGVTSWGASQCLTSYPSVYARVSSFRTWIDETMADNN